MRSLGFACVALAACGSKGQPVEIDASWLGDSQITYDIPFDGPGLGLTSPVLTEGGVIDRMYSCAGANTSPELTWLGHADGTLSYAVVFTDKSGTPLIHSVIFDIPGSATGLPANVEKVYAPTNVAGALQTKAYDNQTRGYLGPCPGTMHTYEFALYALDVAMLPGTTMGTSRAQALALIQMHDLASATLTGTYTP